MSVSLDAEPTRRASTPASKTRGMHLYRSCRDRAPHHEKEGLEMWESILQALAEAGIEVPAGVDTVSVTLPGGQELVAEAPAGS